MKPEKKTSPAKKTAASTKTAAKKGAAARSRRSTASGSTEPSAASKAADKVTEAVESAIKTTRRAAARVKETAEKAGATVKKAATRMRKAAAAAKEDVVPAKAPAAEPTDTAPGGRKTLHIPPILLEGDRPSAPPPAGGPGQRYALGPSAPVEHFAEMEDLPEAYGTRRLLLTARDPHWLYAHWDFTREQLNKYNALSADGHLVVRVYEGDVRGRSITEVQVHPESRNWFIHVGKGSTRYVAELGYYNRARKWNQLSVSGATITPPDTLSEDTSVRFATIPVDVPFDELVRLVKSAVPQSAPLAEAIQQLRAAGYSQLPEPEQFGTGEWTPEQERALASLVTMDQVRRVWIGSLEITELVRRQLEREVSSLSVSQLGLPSSVSLASLASPFGGMERRKGFWFNVNAELIIYGATEPDASVTIGGRQIKLRPDGTFSYRFILPDGSYDLPAQATSVDGDDSRSAHLRFSRRTDFRGDVGAHPQDPGMKPPLVKNVA